MTHTQPTRHLAMGKSGIRARPTEHLRELSGEVHAGQPCGFCGTYVDQCALFSHPFPERVMARSNGDG